MSLHLLDQIVIEHIALCDCQDTVFIEQLGVVLRKLAKQDFVIFADVVAIGRDHKEQNRISLNMTQESCSQAFTLVRTFDDTGDVGHYEGVAIAHLNNAEVRLQGGEGVVCNLWLCGRNNRQKCTLAGIREAYKTNICQHLQFEDKCTLSTLLSGL